MNNEGDDIANQELKKHTFVRGLAFTVGWFVAGTILALLAVASWAAVYIGLPALTGLVFSQPIVIVTNPYIEASDPAGQPVFFNPFFWLAILALAGGLVTCALAHAVRWLVRLRKRRGVAEF